MYRRILSIRITQMAKGEVAKRQNDPGGNMIFGTRQEAKRLARISFGYALLVLGVVAIRTPLPGVLMIVLGLSALETELDWARLLHERMKVVRLRWRGAFEAWWAARHA